MVTFDFSMMCMSCSCHDRKLFITVDKQDDNYMPGHIIVMGGLLENLKKLNDVNVD